MKTNNYYARYMKYLRNTQNKIHYEQLQRKTRVNADRGPSLSEAVDVTVLAEPWRTLSGIHSLGKQIASYTGALALANNAMRVRSPPPPPSPRVNSAQASSTRLKNCRDCCDDKNKHVHIQYCQLCSKKRNGTC